MDRADFHLSLFYIISFELSLIYSMSACSYPVSDTARCNGPQIISVPQNLPINITFLYLEETNIEELDHQSFSQYPNLTHLYMKNNSRLARISANTFTSNTELTAISITDNQALTTIDQLAFNGSFQSLRRLDLTNNNLDALPDLSSLIIYGSTLEIELYLDGNPLRAPTPLCKNPKNSEAEGFSCSFVSVSMRKTKLTRLRADVLKKSKIVMLDLSDNKNLAVIEDNVFTELVSRLHTLILSNNPLLVTLPSSGLENLRVLKFQNCRGIKKIPPTANFVNIKEVYLTYPQHCCAFKRPELQDKLAYEKAIKEFEQYRCKENSMSTSTKLASTGTSTSESTLIPYDNSESPYYHQEIHLRKLLAINWGEIVTPNPDWIPPHEDDPSMPLFLDSTIDPNIDHSIVFPANCSDINFEQLRQDYAAFRDQLICEPKENSFTPCVDIFEEKHWLRSILWTVAVSAVIGNCIVLTFTLASRTKTPLTVTKYLICNLAFSDGMIGTYLLTLAAVDIRTLGQYFNFANWWQFEGGCDGIGFLTVFASVLSVYTLSVITLERWYAISHAIHLTKRMQMKQAVWIMLCGWILSITLAMLPLPPLGFSSYQRTSICLPFKFETVKDKGYILFLLALNVCAFILVLCCYVSIFCQVRGSNASMASDTYLARRMALLVFTDFICWGPVAIVAGLSAGGVNLNKSFLTDESGLYVAKMLLVIFYPLNACANPFLYAIATKQFQKDCVLTFTNFGFCKSRARKMRTPFTHSESQYSTKLNLVRLPSNTTQCTVTSTLLESRGCRPLLPADHSCQTPLVNLRKGSSCAENSDEDAECHKFNTNKFLPQKGLPVDNMAVVLSESENSIDSIDSRQPSEVLHGKGQLVKTDLTRLDHTWEKNLFQSTYADAKASDYDSGTELNHISESEVDDLIPLNVQSDDNDMLSDSESGYRGRIRSVSDDELKTPSIDKDNNVVFNMNVCHAQDGLCTAVNNRRTGVSYDSDDEFLCTKLNVISSMD